MLRKCSPSSPREGLFTSCPPEVLNATGYFQAAMGDVLEAYIDKICLEGVDDWESFEAAVGEFRPPAGAWAFCCSPPGRLLLIKWEEKTFS